MYAIPMRRVSDELRAAREMREGYTPSGIVSWHVALVVCHVSYE